MRILKEVFYKGRINALSVLFLFILIIQAEGKDTVLLPQIINEVERLNINKEIQVFDENDGDFFFIAMNRCANLDDMDLAKRLHSIVLTGSNRQLFTNNLVETKY